MLVSQEENGKYPSHHHNQPSININYFVCVMTTHDVACDERDIVFPPIAEF